MGIAVILAGAILILCSIAIIVIVAMQNERGDGLSGAIMAADNVLGLFMKGGHYVAHFFKPTPVFVIINAIEEIAKPITLAFRLFGNILAGEILIVVLLKLMPIWMPIPAVAWLAFSIFIGGVQAVIFTMLSMAYLANAVKKEEEES